MEQIKGESLLLPAGVLWRVSFFKVTSLLGRLLEEICELLAPFSVAVSVDKTSS